jgi:hypothetical protein
VEELLPAWSRDRVVVRSAYLFGERVARGVYDEGGRAGLYLRMYPDGGAAEGYLEAGRSFHASGFLLSPARRSRPDRRGPAVRVPRRRAAPGRAAFAAQARRLLASAARARAAGGAARPR